MARNKKKSKSVPLAKKKNGISNVVGSIAKVAGGILPGPLGLAAKGLGKLFNDPSWWQDPRVSAPSSNQPLLAYKVAAAGGTTVSSGFMYFNRPWLLEVSANPFETIPKHPFNVDETLVNQYVIRDIRMAIGAVPLQTPLSYTQSFNAMARVAALYHHVRKLIWLIDNPKPHLPAYQVIYPAMRTTSYPQLKALSDRLREAMRSYVKLPNVLLNVLAWRYGRVYKALDDGQSAYVLYNPITLAETVDHMTEYFESQITVLQSNSQAGADIHRTYHDHDQDVLIHDDTQAIYDLKEKCLRDNFTASNFGATTLAKDGSPATTSTPEEDTAEPHAIEQPDYDFIALFFDSELDQDAIALSSTVSLSTAQDPVNNSLFPVAYAQAHVVDPLGTAPAGIIVATEGALNTVVRLAPDFTVNSGSTGAGSAWIYRMNWHNLYTQPSNRVFGIFSLAHQLGYHNSLENTHKGGSMDSASTVLLNPEACDMAFVDKRTIQQFKEYAFANLVSRKVKRAESATSQVDAVLKEMSHVVDESEPG